STRACWNRTGITYCHAFQAIKRIRTDYIPMKVLKFGGTSVGSADRIKNLINIINPDERQVIVLSAVAGTTNALVAIAAAFASDEKEEAKSLIQALRAEYEELLEQLFATPEGLENGRNLIDYQFDLIQSFSNQIFTQA